MKRILAFTFLLTSTLAFGACNQCYDCEARDTEDGSVHHQEEICGKSDAEQWEATYDDPLVESEASCSEID